MSWLSEFVDVYNQNEKNLGKTNYKVYHLKKNEEDKRRLRPDGTEAR